MIDICKNEDDAYNYGVDLKLSNNGRNQFVEIVKHCSDQQRKLFMFLNRFAEGYCSTN